MEDALKGLGMWAIGVVVVMLSITGLAYIVTGGGGEDRVSPAPAPADTRVPLDLQDLYERIGDLEKLATEGPCALLWEKYERAKSLPSDEWNDPNEAFERWLICYERNYGPIEPP